ncbi:hypothetical protein [Allorhodopirellula solitaria]|uniref:Uncharacterized protein n=1 Tax=Allorhodopirellula solitaria TaxID=2527987 RepID=A0A5C5XN75_9BACT|nr:hypothetical protein [Allorhodopirellula solitaria]TWT64607.1 hypothetical protein CA85_37400 [Allorhodopirellula solitaria]
MKNEIHRVSLGLLALMTLGGCASFNDCYYEKTQRVRALKEYIHCGQPDCAEFARDYKAGWIDGFYEVATGGSDCPPAVAPERYYKPEQILKYCDKKRHDYYSGWQDGAARASQFPDTHYLRIYETSECPFPRCEKPCSDGQCGPCREAFVGMSATTEMIETAPTPSTTVPAPTTTVPAPTTTVPAAMPTLPAEFEYSEDIDLHSSSNQTIQPQRDSALNLTSPKSNELDGPSVGTAAESVALPLPKPSANTLTDIPTLPLIPPAPAPEPAAVPMPAAEQTPAAADVIAATQAAESEEAPLVSIPGYRATSEWSRPTAQPTQAKPVGFIRMVEPIQAAPKSSPVIEGAEPIVIVDAPYQRFQMSDSETEDKAVIKLVE